MNIHQKSIISAPAPRHKFNMQLESCKDSIFFAQLNFENNLLDQLRVGARNNASPKHFCTIEIYKPLFDVYQFAIHNCQL